MNSKLFIVVTVFLFVLLVNAKSGSEESTSAEMKEAIDALLHQHTKHNRRSCGAGAVFKIMELCPNLCTISDDNIYEDMCKGHLSDYAIIKRCCP